MAHKNNKFTSSILNSKDGRSLSKANQSKTNIQDAIALHQQGELDQAEKIYQQLLVANPINSEVLHLIGVIAYQRSQFQHAIDLISIAIEINPDKVLHVPPVVASPRLVVSPAHTLVVPVMGAGSGSIVTAAVVIQPVGSI